MLRGQRTRPRWRLIAVVSTLIAIWGFLEASFVDAKPAKPRLTVTSGDLRTVASGPRAIATLSDSEGCPSAKDLLTTRDPSGLYVTCPDPPPRNCLRYAFKPWPSEVFCFDASTNSGSDGVLLGKLWSWGCGLGSSDCYPKTCRVDRAIAVMNYRQAWALASDISIPIAPPATIPAQMMIDFLTRMSLARLHLAIYAASKANMDFTCGDDSHEWVEQQKTKLKKPSLSISFSGSLPVPKAWETARKAKAWALLATQAVRIASQSRSFSSNGDLSVSVGQTKRKGRFSYSLDPDGTASLQVRVLG